MGVVLAFPFFRPSLFILVSLRFVQNSWISISKFPANTHMYTEESVFGLTSFASPALDTLLLLLLFTWMHKGKIAKCQGSIPGLYTYVKHSTQLSIVFFLDFVVAVDVVIIFIYAIELRRRVQRLSKRTNAFSHDEDEYDVHQTVKMSSFVWIWFMCQSFCVFFFLGVAACFIFGALSGQWLVMCMCEMRIKCLFENEMPH